MAIKSIFKILVIAILIITILDCSYADTGPYVGENQAKNVAQCYLNSHNLLYKVTTATFMIELYDYQKTKHKKWVSSSQFDTMRKNNETFEGEPVDNYYGSGTPCAWKVHVSNSQGKEIGSIWIDVDGNGAIIKIDLPSNKQNTKIQNNTNSSQTTNITNQTFPESNNQPTSSGNNTGIIFGIITLVIAIGAGYLIYTRI